MLNKGKTPPVADLVGIGQCGAAHRCANANRIERVGLDVQARFDIAQAFAIGQLGEGQGVKLFGAGQRSGTQVSAVTGYTACETKSRELNPQTA